MPRTAPLLLLALTVVAACAERDARSASEPLSMTPLPGPTTGVSAQPSLAAMPDGRLLLTWQEAADSGHAVRLAFLDDSTWSAPVTVASGRPFFVNWADFPTALALDERRLAVHWLEKEGADDYAYGVRIAWSEDGGRTWSDPVRPHRDSTETEHGFVSLLPAGDGALHAFWLDGREYATERREMTLRSARLTPDGMTDEHVLDERICDCCQTDAARTADGMVVVYRDRSADEIRDVAVVRGRGGEWSPPVTVHDDGWHIEGCPVNGPAIAAEGDDVAVAWYTGANDSARVFVAFSSDGGATFGEPVRVDDGDPDGRVDLVLAPDGGAVVAWIERVADAGELRVRRVDGAAGAAAAPAALTIAQMTGGRAAGFPRMARRADDVVIAWTDVDAQRVRVARIPLRR